MKKYNNIEFNINNIGQVVELYGWVAKKRNLGGLIFIDLRDRSGIIQLVVRPDNKYYDLASSLKTESVIKANGTICERESKNTKIPTGEVEVIVEELVLESMAHDLPYELTSDTTALEDTRLKYRYLELRREGVRDKLITRSNLMHSIRNFFYDEGFIEVETPILCKSTPEGARDYLVPSRVNKGKFYALPQSPQLFKQLLMVGGIEKYFQIAKCFRDEDLRADRQPEFTQVDLEMSFVEEEDVMSTTERLIKKVFKGQKGGMLGMGLLVGAMDIATANNTVAIVMANPIAKEMADNYGISPRKAASILDTFSCIFQGVIPYGAQMLVALSVAAGLGQSVSAFEIMPNLLYPYMLLLSSLVFVFIVPSKEKK